MTKSIGKFLRRCEGAVAIEAALMLPVLIGIVVASFGLYDGFRHYTSSVRAGNAVADSISRIEAVLTPEDIEGLHEVFQYMTRQSEGTALRVSQFRREGTRTILDWSHASGIITELTHENAGFARNRLPALQDGSHILLVETRFEYEPILGFDLAPLEFENFMPVRPRFGDRVIFSLSTQANYCQSNCNISEGLGVEPLIPNGTQTPAPGVP